jgi:thiamine-phosphate pyrophosphorylase
MSHSPVRRLDFSDVALYAVTPEPADTPDLLQKIEGLLEGGVDAVQLRSRKLTDRAFIKLGHEIKERCHQSGALFIVDNRIDLALATDADGLHLGHEDLPIAFAREWFGHRKVIGLSTHSLPEAIEAQRAGADYVSCGPLWATPTKPDYKAVGLDLIGFYKAAIRVPFVAIGGINQQNIDQVVESGAKTIAVVRALFETNDPAGLAREFKRKIQKNWNALEASAWA